MDEQRIPTKPEIEAAVREILASRAGSQKFAPNLFNDCVKELTDFYESQEKLSHKSNEIQLS